MTTNQTTENIAGAEQRVIAFFRSREAAYRAISELKDAGFTSEQIGLISVGENQESRSAEAGASTESFWDKVKNFFAGDSTEDVDYQDSASRLNWERNRADYYYRGLHEGGALVSVTGLRIEDACRILEGAGGDLRESGFESVGTGQQSDVGTGQQGDKEYEDGPRIQLRGEVLRTIKERVQRGEVRLRKEVVTENQTVEVPVTREELVVERVPVSEQKTAAGEIGGGQEIRVPLSEERARVEKQQVVQDEVRVGQRAVQKTERVSDDVRHEELRVDKEGDVEVDTRGRQKGKKPAA